MFDDPGGILPVQEQAEEGVEVILTQQHYIPDFLGIPFVLFKLPSELREIMSKGMPPVIVQQLVPIDWKDKWGSMKPLDWGAR